MQTILTTSVNEPNEGILRHVKSIDLRGIAKGNKLIHIDITPHHNSQENTRSLRSPNSQPTDGKISFAK